MKTITLTITDDGNLKMSHNGFESDFEINGLLQTVLMHRCMNQFGLPSNVVNEEKESVES